MLICAAQIKTKLGNVESNINNHIRLIKVAISKGINFIFFPELSITGYAPSLAEKIAMEVNDYRLDIFQELSDKYKITISLGIPIKERKGIYIGMIIIREKEKRLLYAKQLLHSDERPYFIKGDKQVKVDYNNETIVPAICFESIQPSHVINAKKIGATVYIASVAKNESGFLKGSEHYSEISKKYDLLTIMANLYGDCEGFKSFGSSSVWNNKGECIAQLPINESGLVGIDTNTHKPFTYL